MFAAFAGVDTDASVIDNTLNTTALTQPRSTHAAGPGQDLMTGLPNAGFVPLPSPNVGGQNGSGRPLGWSTGFQSWAKRWAPFTGRIVPFAPIVNPVQGQVGQTNRANRLYAGVMDQLFSYTPSLQEYATRYVGSIQPNTQVTSVNGVSV